MNTFFSQDEANLLIRLLIAHIITDFFLQTDRGIASKKTGLLRSGSFWLHGIYTGLFAALFLWKSISLPIVAFITLSHLIIDYCKIAISRQVSDARWPQKDVWLFIIDQLLHVAVLITAWLIIINGTGKMMDALDALLNSYPFFLKALAYLVVAGPVTYLIRFLTVKWADDISIDNNSLKSAGKWIGILERIIVVTLIFIEQYSAIGFLVTAKSILRLIDKPETTIETSTQKAFSARKHTEYVLIGTFLSFGMAIAVGLLTNWLLKP